MDHSFALPYLTFISNAFAAYIHIAYNRAFVSVMMHAGILFTALNTF